MKVVVVLFALLAIAFAAPQFGGFGGGYPGFGGGFGGGASSAQAGASSQSFNAGGGFPGL